MVVTRGKKVALAVCGILFATWLVGVMRGEEAWFPAPQAALPVVQQSAAERDSVRAACAFLHHPSTAPEQFAECVRNPPFDETTRRQLNDIAGTP